MAERTLQYNLVGKDRLSGTLKQASGGFGGLAMKVGVAAAAYVGFKAVTKMVSSTMRKMNELMKESISLAGTQERAEVKLATAMRAAGIYTQEAFQANLDMASGFQRLTTHGDEAIIAIQAVLTNMGGLSGPIMKDAIEATLNLAETWDMNVSAAAMQVAKAAGGYTSSLTRYGVTLDKAIPESEKFAKALEIINTKMAGAAQAQAKTYTGLIKSLGNAWFDAYEKLGDYIVRSPAVRATLENLIGLIAGPGGLQEVILSGTETAHKATAMVIDSAYGLVISLLQTVSSVHKSMSELFKEIEIWNERLEAINKIITLRERLARAIQESIAARRAEKEQNEAWVVSIGQTEMASNKTRTALDYLTMTIEQQRRNLPSAIAKWEEFFQAMEEGREKMGVGPPAEGGAPAKPEIPILDVPEDLPEIWREALAKIETNTTNTTDDMALSFEQRFTNRAILNMQHFTDFMVDAMWDTKMKFKDIWQAMAKDMMKFFIWEGVKKLGMLLLLEKGGPIPAAIPGAQRGATIPGSRRYKRDIVPFWGVPGEKIIPTEQSDRYAPVLDAMIREARTGVPAFQSAGIADGATININIPVQTLDAGSFQDSVRHGMIKRELESAVRSAYLELEVH